MRLSWRKLTRRACTVSQIGDHFGRKPIWLLSLLAGIVGFVLVASAHHIGQAIVSSVSERSVTMLSMFCRLALRSLVSLSPTLAIWAQRKFLFGCAIGQADSVCSVPLRFYHVDNVALQRLLSNLEAI